jgi:hypothetical protein
VNPGEFESAIHTGDHLRQTVSGKMFMVNQTRSPGLYIAVEVDPKTREKINSDLFVLKNSDDLILLPREGIRSK